MTELFRHTVSLLVGALCVLIISTIPLEAATSFGVQTCTTIDNNWKQYEQQIKGANTKVSDVVLNACQAIGGGCTFTSGYRSPEENESAKGATHSQHLTGKAIDVSVPDGKEKEFITLAICGLRRVNNCEGGIGYYESKAIHVDVRVGTTNVWSAGKSTSGYRRANIIQNVSDPEARNILYSFGDGKCTDGSIQGDYSEEEIYGPPVQYTPPTGMPSFFTPSYSGQPNFQSTQFQTPISTVGGGEILSPTSLIYDSLSTPSSFDSGTLLAFTDTVSTDNNNMDEGEDKGIQNSSVQTQQKDAHREESYTSTNSRVDGVDTQVKEVQTIFAEDTSESNILSVGDSFLQKIAILSRSADIFYGVHKPSDKVVNNANNSSAQNGNAFPQFVSGERVVVENEKNISQVLHNSLYITEVGAKLGLYFGLIHGASPMVIGSAPRTLLRVLGEGASMRVYNPFSI